MLVEGTHFLPDTKAGRPRLENPGGECLRHRRDGRSAALGDAGHGAAGRPMKPGSRPFAAGFFACAREFGVDVIGGDTTRGPRNFCVTIFGEVAAGAALAPQRRPGRRGNLGLRPAGTCRAWGWPTCKGARCSTRPPLADCIAALQRPQPRVALGLALSGLATAAIDVSDGLLGDLGHILEQSGLAARLQIAVLPAPTLERQAWLAGGDDYELVFTAPAARQPQIAALSLALDLPLTRIGTVEAGPAGQIDLRDAGGGNRSRIDHPRLRAFCRG
jgi:thiamine-monophosphate kinase